MVAAVADMVVVDMAVVDMAVAAAVDTSAGMLAVDTLWPPPALLAMLWSDLDRVYASRPGIAPVYSSRMDIAAISGTAVGGTTALARAGVGRTSMASTFGCAIRALQSPALRLAAFTNI